MRLPAVFLLALALSLGISLAAPPEVAAQNALTQNKQRAVPVKASPKKKKPRKRAEPKPESLPWPDNVKALAGASGAVLVVDHHARPDENSELISLNPDKDYVPASILKLVTSASALVALGPDYRFRTDFYLDQNLNLWIKGYGDPFLVSEELCFIVEQLKLRGLAKVNGIYLDASFFQEGEVVDGSTFTLNPYDAYNGALGVNFNTVNFLIDSSDQIVEFNECTPLTPIALDMRKKHVPAKKRKKKTRSFSMNISESPELALEHAGQLIRELLVKNEVTVEGTVIIGREVPPELKPFYEHLSTKNLQEMIVEVLKYSSNYVTNQIFLTMGAEIYGAPGNFEKGKLVVDDFLRAFELPRLTIVEGSGLSRNNLLTARQMSEVLKVMEPARILIKSASDGSVYYKTGTMTNIQTLAGYLERPGRPNEPLAFVILLNGTYAPGTREKILSALKAHFVDESDKEVS